MKIILSRKGFDSSTGKRASFITQKRELVSLPIPDRQNARHGTTYQKITTPIGSLGTILPAIKARTKGNPPQPLVGYDLAHLDPDLSQNSISRNGRWIGAFGQRTSGAISILINHRVGPGDLFLFFGWFKEQSHTFPVPVYQRGAANLHVIFGYLQVDAVYCNAQIPQLLQKYPGLSDHPHVCAPRNAAPNNRIFVGRQNLSLPDVSKNLPGAGLFNYDCKRVLTRQGMTRSHWLLRGIGNGSNLPPPFVRSPGLFKNWRRVGNDWEVTEFGVGQEFLIDSQIFPSALTWAGTLF